MSLNNQPCMTPANIRLDEDVFRLRVQKTSSRRLQDVLIKTNIFAILIRLQKMSSRRLQDVLIKTNIFVLFIRLQDVFKTSSRSLAKTSSRHLQDVFKTFPRRLQDIFKTPSTRFEEVFKTSSRHLQDVLQRCFQDGFKTYDQVMLFLLTNFQVVFKTYSQCF